MNLEFSFKNIPIWQLVNEPWDQIPQMKTAGIIPSMLSTVIFKNFLEWIPQVASESDLAILRKKSLQYSVNQQSTSSAFKACKIFHKHLSKTNPHDLNDDCQDFIKGYELRFSDGKSMNIPGYYKQLLAKESHVFKALFNDPVKEKNSHVVSIQVSEKHFKTMLDILVNEPKEIPVIDLEELIEFMEAADLLQMESIYFFAKKALGEMIVNQFELSNDHFEITMVIREHPILGRDGDILNALDTYQKKYINSFDQIEEWLLKTNPDHLEKIKAIDLSKFDLSDEAINSLIKSCPNLCQMSMKTIVDPEQLVRFPHLRTLNLIRYKIKDTDLEQLGILPHLQVLNLFGCIKITDAGLEHLSKLSQLKELNLFKPQCGNHASYLKTHSPRNYYAITGAGLEHLSKLTHLQSLHLECNNIADAGLEHLAKLTRLQSLHLECNNIADAGFEHLAKLTRLQSLHLECNNIADAGLEHLAKLTYLQTLDLTWCRNIPDAGLKHLAKLAHLQILNLSWCRKITDTGLEHLAKLAHLQALDLSWCHNITNAGLEHLEKLTHLQTLDLTWCHNITNAGLNHLAELNDLQSLNLSGCLEITDDGLKHLAKLPQLQSLDLSGCKNITDAGLEHLVKLSQLQTLYLNFCDKITDTGLKHLAKLSHLKTINLCDCEKITDACIEHLEKLHHLKIVQLCWCNKITDVGLERLVNLPHLQLLEWGRAKAFRKRAHTAKLGEEGTKKRKTNG